MKIWFTAKELAAAALPGLPTTKQGWNIYAQRENWRSQTDKCRERARRGGGAEYHIDLLPAEARSVLASGQIGAVAARIESAVVTTAAPAVAKIGAVAVRPEDAEAAAAEPASLQLTADALEARDARLAILAAADRCAQERGLPFSVSDKDFCGAYALGQIVPDAWVRTKVRKTSPKALQTWRAARKRGDLSKLGVDRGLARRGKGFLEVAEGGAVRTYILALITRQPHLSADHVQKLVRDKFPGVEVSIRRTQGFLKALKNDNAVLLTRLTNPDRFKSHYRVSGVNSHPCTRLNQLWMIDASPADVMLINGRYSIYACIDVFSRRLIVYVTKTPRSEAVQLLMRAAILLWGVPECVKTDNGSDFVAVATKRLFTLLKIDTETSDPFSPEQKGHIERAIKTFQHDLCPLLPGYVGHNVADRKVIEERKALSQRIGATEDIVFSVNLDDRDLQRYCFEWSQGRYKSRKHAGLGNRTPREVAAEYQGEIRRIEDRHALDLLLVPVAGVRTVGKLGIRIDHSFYLCPTVMPGEQVMARIDPQDMGHAWLFSPDGAHFLGDAICPELAGVDGAAAVARARAEQTRILKEGAAEIQREMRKIKPRDMVDAVLRQSGQVVALTDYQRGTMSTPALDAARDAMAGREPLVLNVEREKPAPRQIAAPVAAVVTLPETRDQRFRRALALEEEVKAGVRISNEDAIWLGAYQQQAEYAAMRNVFENFGEEGLR